ncbi:MAG TPA: ABC transporter permease, partial [Rhodospirillales bacterium]|nr:ABC transporter permease [Rhodospirillales bacterium]
MTMVTAAATASPTRSRLRAGLPFWLAALALSFFFAYAPRGLVPRWALRLPRNLEIPLDRYLSQWMDWLVTQASFGPFTFKDTTRGFAWLMEWPLAFAKNLLVTGFMLGQGSAAQQLTAPVSWAAVILFAGLLAARFGGARLAVLVVGCFVYLALFGQWPSAMVTLSSILIAVPF